MSLEEKSHLYYDIRLKSNKIHFIFLTPTFLEFSHSSHKHINIFMFGDKSIPLWKLEISENVL